jgi:hypothetical protein
LALAKRGEGAWREIEDLIVMRNASAYDRAATLLLDLREVAAEASKRRASRAALRRFTAVTQKKVN